MSFVWTPERCELLAELVEKKMSARQIAGEFQISRGAIIGKVNRLGLKLKGANPNHAQGRPNKLTALMFAGMAYKTKRAKHKRRNQFSKLDDVRSLHIPLLDLRRQMCCFPTTSDKPHLFCGLPTDKGQSYCEHHYFICYQPPKKRAA